MKIKELFENAIPHQQRVSSGKLVIELALANIPSGDTRTRLTKNIKFVFPKANVTFEQEACITVFDNITQSHLEEVDILNNDVIQTVQETIGDTKGEPIDWGKYYLEFDGVPSFRVNVENVTIHCMDNTYGLSGIDKVIGSGVIELVISDFEKIKGNILSLAKIGTHTDVYIESLKNGNLQRQIGDMLDKHRSSKNVFGFQEDLIDAGYKDYAEL